jgi:hypothetical protein
MIKYTRLLRVLGALFILGGLVRILANQALFETMLMGHLWSDHPYFLYVYKVLGAFVILTGLIIYGISFRPEAQKNILSALIYGLILIGLIMAITGYMAGLSPFFYVLDFIFCFILAFIFYRIKTKT